MTSKNTEKNKDSIKEFVKEINPVLIVNNAALKPYIETFNYSPENLYQQPLGSLVGFFEIKDYSEDSAYVVNFLTSVLKKEYFINPKRSVTESLDSALHKVNVALSELVKHGNVNWLGKLDGAVCVLEKNSLHFGVSGDAKVFLSRGQHFSNISEGLASDEPDPHPLKTFVNVSSGRLEKSDRVIITSDDLFHIITVTQLSKQIQRLSGDKFIQFLNTALSNELEMATTIVIDVSDEKKKILPKPKLEEVVEETAFNAFSKTAFEKKKRNSTESVQEALKKTDEDSIDSDDGEYTDKKTGHIYIQGQENQLPQTSQFQIYLSIAKENLSDFAYATKNATKKKITATRKEILKAYETYKKNREIIKQQKAQEAQQRAIELEKIEKERLELENQRQMELAKQEELRQQEAEKIQQEEIQRTASTKVNIIEIKEKQQREQIVKQEMPSVAQIKRQPKPENIPTAKPLSLQEKIARAKLEIEQSIPVHQSEKSKVNSNDKDPSLSKLESFWNNSREQQRKFAPVEEKKTSKAIPDFKKIRNVFISFSSKQKMVIALILLAIFTIPLVAVKLLSLSEKKIAIEEPAPAPTLSQILSQDKNISLSTELIPALSKNDIIAVEIFDGSPFYIGKTSITGSLDDTKKEVSLPADSGNVISSAFMKDLNLIFLITDKKKILSYSPISQQFKDNKIDFVETANMNAIGTYLTYLYMFDETANQIYRYPRAEGGFGAKTDRLNDNTSLAKIKDVAIDENIYFISNNKVTKIFEGAKQEMTFEQSATLINFDQIYTTVENNFIYIVDLKNSRLIQYAKDGSLSNQYFNEQIKNSTSFSVDEKNKKAYFVTPSQVLSLSL